MTGDALKATDPQTYLCRCEEKSTADEIPLNPAENDVSRAVLEAPVAIFSSRFSEGYPGKRYYQGQLGWMSMALTMGGQPTHEGRALSRKFPAPGISA